MLVGFSSLLPWLLDLPIRDGNTASSFFLPKQATTFRPSYQGWKLLGSQALVDGEPLLLDLPIRDGNPPAAGRTSRGSAPFRPSYQGWKLAERIIGVKPTRAVAQIVYIKAQVAEYP